MTQCALAVGLDRGTRSQFLSRAGSRNLAVEWVTKAHQATVMATSRRYEIVACAYPLPDMVMRQFGQAIRRRDSASRDAALLVLSLPDMQAEARLGLPSGRTLVRSRRDPGPCLHEAIGHLLRVAPRRALDVRVDLFLDEDDETAATMARLINVSRTGMLVGYPDLPEMGRRCSFEFRTGHTGDTVSGAGEIVRHTHKGRENAVGFGVRFATFPSDSEQRLRAYLEPSRNPAD